MNRTLNLNPRRSAHISACIYHDSPPGISPTRIARDLLDKKELHGEYALSSKISPVRKSLDGSSSSGESTGLRNWFDRCNDRPEIRLDQAFVDSEPPYFVHEHDTSNTSNEISKSSRNRRAGHHQSHGHVNPLGLHSVTNDGSTDGFRSVIDDLTIENRRLKDRLRKYETSYDAHLEKDKLFEVKVHGLPAKKKRELEETLRAFAERINGSDTTSTEILRRAAHQHMLVPTSKTISSPCTSNFRTADSAYVSMSNSGPTSSSTLNCFGRERNLDTVNDKEQVQSYLQDIPVAPLPKHSLVMTERQKKKIVVRRLEQLFTGRNGVTARDLSQPLQHQDLSNSAARDDRTADNEHPSIEGVREAQILPFEMEVDSKRPGILTENYSQKIELSRGPSCSMSDGPDSSTPEQRPTRALDLDPDRAQVPSDTVEYIRHLGLSAPQLVTENVADVTGDAEGWIYLNLLANMAQLHIINVTPDFIRSAVSDVSEMFQLSRDGRKIRWRGGTAETRLSSDSEASSLQSLSPHVSNSLNQTGRKRRKIDVGRSPSAPVDIRDRKSSAGFTRTNALYYKPLFHHRASSPEELTSFDESGSATHQSYAADRAIGGLSRTPHAWNRGPHSESHGSNSRDHGPIVFYSGAQFCTDLSGDRGSISAPIQLTGVGKDGYSDHAQNILGSTSINDCPNLSRTHSGSPLALRPLENYSKIPDDVLIDEPRAKAPDTRPQDLDVSLDWSPSHSGPTARLLDFSASGLGGTQPADHFAVTVETRRTILDSHMQAKLSRFSTTGPTSRKLLYDIPKSCLASSRGPELLSAERMTPGSACLGASRSASLPQTLPVGELPVRTEILSVKFSMLEPSALPAPLAYYTLLSSSDEDSDSDSSSSSSGISHCSAGIPFSPRPYLPVSQHFSGFLRTQDCKEALDLGEMEGNEGGIDEDSEGTVEMAAQIRCQL